MIPRRIEDFTKYDDYIKSQLGSVTNANIMGLECKRTRTENNSREHITFRDSKFDEMSDNVKKYYSDVKFTSSVDSSVTLTSIFQNSDEGMFFKNSLLFLYLLVGEKPTEPEMVKYSKNLFLGKYDELIQSKNPDEVYDDESFKGFYDGVFERIEITCRENKSVCIQSFVNGEGGIFGLHSVAIVFWISDGKLCCGLYDPMYYEREDSNFLWAVNSIYITLKMEFHKIKRDITIYNLSELFCVKNEKGTHCIQYPIDAQYCAIYTLYFFYLYGKHNFPKNLDDIKTVVEETFVDTPSQVLRNPCIATNKFRIVMTSFILTVLTIISDDITVLNKIKEVYETTLSKTYRFEGANIPKESYSLLHPDILHYLLEKNTKFTPRIRHGGSRKNRYRTKKAFYKKNRSKTKRLSTRL